MTKERSRIRGRSPRRVAPNVSQRFVRSVLGREVLRDVAAVLAAEGIAVMPLKGVLFQLLLYADPAARAISDLDVLVPQPCFGCAVRALLRAGFRPRSAARSLIECALWSPRGMVVDLHQQLFSRGRYELSTEAVFLRATRDERLLGVPLHLAHPHDTVAHLIGKFVSDREGGEPLRRLEEIELWAERCKIDPWRLGPHLSDCGMGRAARYTFRRGQELSGKPFFASALAALPPDPIGRACARLARALLPELAQTSWGALPAHLLNRSLPNGGASLALSAADRLRHRWLSRWGGGGDWSPFFGPEATASRGAGVRDVHRSALAQTALARRVGARRSRAFTLGVDPGRAPK